MIGKLGTLGPKRAGGRTGGYACLLRSLEMEEVKVLTDSKINIGMLMSKFPYFFVCDGFSGDIRPQNVRVVEVDLVSSNRVKVFSSEQFGSKGIPKIS